jgi:hypothetical protein
MGQYFRPINLNNMEWFNPRSYNDNGMKLTEHSWVGNSFVGAVMALLQPTMSWHKARVVWCGDYYGPSKDEPLDGEIPYYKMVPFSGEQKNVPPITEKMQKLVILVNHTKKEYVDYRKSISKDGWMVNPLPILTALGNDRGGGDYRSDQPDYDKVGIWAGDSLSVETEIPYGFWELKVNFQD